MKHLTRWVRRRRYQLEESFRIPQAVEESAPNTEMCVEPICPRCHGYPAYEFQPFCQDCGQALDWTGWYDDASLLLL